MKLAERLAKSAYEQWKKRDGYTFLSAWEERTIAHRTEDTEEAQNWLAALRSLADKPDSGVVVVEGGFPGEKARCPDCGIVRFDEDGCCATCGADTTPEPCYWISVSGPGRKLVLDWEEK